MTTVAKYAIRVAPLFHWHLQAVINRVVPLATSVEEVKQNYHQMVEISVETKEELWRWMQVAQDHNGTPLLMSPPDLIIKSDASRLGWGATSEFLMKFLACTKLAQVKLLLSQCIFNCSNHI